MLKLNFSQSFSLVLFPWPSVFCFIEQATKKKKNHLKIFRFLRIAKFSLGLMDFCHVLPFVRSFDPTYTFLIIPNRGLCCYLQVRAKQVCIRLSNRHRHKTKIALYYHLLSSVLRVDIQCDCERFRALRCKALCKTLTRRPFKMRRFVRSMSRALCAHKTTPTTAAAVINCVSSTLKMLHLRQTKRF